MTTGTDPINPLIPAEPRKGDFGPKPLTMQQATLRQGPSPIPNFFKADGSVTYFPDKTTFGSLGTRLKLFAAETLDPFDTPDIQGAFVTSGAGWIAHFQNKTEAQAIKLGVKEFDGLYFNNDSQQTEEPTVANFHTYIDPILRATLAAKGFNFELLASKPTLQEAAETVQYFILVDRLRHNIEANYDGWYEGLAGNAAALLVDGLTDPANLLAGGIGGGVRVVGKNIAKRMVAGEIPLRSMTARQKMALNVAGRLGRNQSVSGTLMDTTFTRRNAGWMLALDGATIGAFYDYHAQGAEKDLINKYIDPDMDEYSLFRTALGGGIGAVLAGGIGGLLLQGNLRKADYARAALIDPNFVGPMPTSSQVAARTAVFANAADELNPDAVIPARIAQKEKEVNRPLSDQSPMTPEEIRADVHNSIISEWLEANQESRRPEAVEAVNAARKAGKTDEEIARFVVQKPTVDEMGRFIGAEKGDEIAKIQTEIKRLEQAIVTATGEGKTAKQIGYIKGALTRQKKKLQGVRDRPLPGNSRLRQMMLDQDILHEKLAKLTIDGQKKNEKEIRKILSDLNDHDFKIRQILTDLTGGEATRFVKDKDGNLVLKNTEKAQIMGQPGEVGLVDILPRTRKIPAGLQADILSALQWTDGGLSFPVIQERKTAKFLNARPIRWVSNVGTRRYDIETAVAKSQAVGLLADMIEPLGLTSSSMRPGQPKVRSLSHAYLRNHARVERALGAPVDALIRAYGRNRQELNTKFREAYQIAGGVQRPDVTDPLVKNLAKAMRQMYDDFGEQGIRSGVITSRLDDFVHIILNPEVAKNHMTEMSDLLFNRYYKHYVEATGGDREVHLNTLVKLGVVVYEDGFPRLSKSVMSDSEAIPKTVDDLANVVIDLGDGTFGSVLNRYDQALPESLLEDAEFAIANRVAPERGRKLSTKARAEGRDSQGQRAPLTDSQRKIEQDFWLSNEVMDLGVVQVNPLITAKQYVYGSANRFAQQEVINSVTGRRDITFEGLLEYIRRELLADLPATEANKLWANRVVDTLMDAEGELSGRTLLAGEGDSASQFVAANVTNIANAFVQPGVGFAMASLEIPSMLMELAHAGGVKPLVQNFIKLAKDPNLSKEVLRSLGAAFDFSTREMRINVSNGMVDENIGRSWGFRLGAPFRQIKDVWRGEKTGIRTMPGGGNKAALLTTSVTEGMSDLARMGSGEEFLTNRFRSLAGYIYRQMAFEYLDKLGKLTELKAAKYGDKVLDIKEMKTLAREAGFGNKWWVVNDFVNGGLTDPNFIEAAQALRALGLKDFGDPTKVASALASAADRDLRYRLQQSMSILDDFAADRVNSLIIKPGVWDRAPHAQNPIIKMVNVFLSYPRAFRSRRLRAVADRGPASLAFWSSAWLTMELLNRQMQMLLFGGETVEGLAQAWEDDPYGMLRRGLIMVPFMGPYQQSLYEIVESVAKDHTNISIGGAPALSITGTLIQDFVKLTKAPFSDDELDIKSLNRVKRALPFVNWFPVRVMESLVNQATADD